MQPEKENYDRGAVQPETITRRTGSLIKLRPEYEERYYILHKHTFPGVLERIRKSNIRNYSIFLYDGFLFSYFEYVGKDYEADMHAVADTTTKEWWKLTDPMQEPLPTRKQGEWWLEMKLLLHYDEIMAHHGRQERSAYTVTMHSGSENSISDIITPDRFFNDKPGDVHLHNLSLYCNNDMLFLYFECPGRDCVNNVENYLMKQDTAVQNNSYNQEHGISWHKMSEVFHTE